VQNDRCRYRGQSDEERVVRERREHRDRGEAAAEIDDGRDAKQSGRA
jgi:hypothetical protein